MDMMMDALKGDVEEVPKETAKGTALIEKVSFQTVWKNVSF